MCSTIIIVSYDEKKPPSVEYLREIKKLSSKYNLKLIMLTALELNEPLESLVIEIGPYKLKGTPSNQQLEIAIKAAIDRQAQMDEIHLKRNGKHKKEIFHFGVWDKIGLWLNRHYLLLINLFMALFIGVAFLAPVFMKIGWDSAATYIYTVNKILCHQLAFRSFFLFGQQSIYPRNLANINIPITYEVLVGHNQIDILEARNYIGDIVHGYKVALCQRDIAMYGSFLIFGILFAVLKEKIKTIKFWVWILFGLFPIALDGGSQLLGLGLNVTWFPERESTPLLRTFTGILFGVFTAWYLFPLIAEAINEKRKILKRSKIIHSQLIKQSQID